ncbi:hypothetical protein HPB52_006955 [Rhipicephalus sanguineus]|uniref:Uncharacterized protein n=1 Tax=Rhipicephalus sanguineus TaxID=34632 RepID=A0A9D4PI98_RHISA|nr:hypothetical protein HPB52_006955 [Rhipicephalus sanguineus]
MAHHAARVSLFAQVVAENGTLRRLRLPSVKCPCAHSWMSEAHLDPPDPDSADKMAPWLRAVRNNSTLRELEIDLGGFGVPECREFFEAVADNDTLNSVIVRRLPTERDVDGICKTIRERGIADRVQIGNHHVSPMDVSALHECPEITGVTISSRHFDANWSQMCALFKTLARCPHVTSLSVHCWAFHESVFESLIAYMGSTKTLTKIEVSITTVLPEMTDEQHLDLEGRLVDAAASIPSLVEVNITGILQYRKHCAAFAGSVAAKRRRLTRLQITLANKSNRTFTNLYTPQELANPSRKISCKEDSSYDNGHAAVREITARNSNDVSAAARYVMGSKRDSDIGARVIEVLHDHPWLVHKVRRQAEVGVGEAKAKIARALKRVRTCGIDEYMRLAGVIKKRAGPR